MLHDRSCRGGFEERSQALFGGSTGSLLGEAASAPKSEGRKFPGCVVCACTELLKRFAVEGNPKLST